VGRDAWRAGAVVKPPKARTTRTLNRGLNEEWIRTSMSSKDINSVDEGVDRESPNTLMRFDSKIHPARDLP